MIEETVKRIVLGITGGIAAYKAAELTRLLKKSGIEVQVVMTEAGTKFVTPITLQALSGNKVYVDSWDDTIANNMAHIELSRNANAILITPATADFIAKLANGLADDLLSTLCIARQPTCPLMVAPAMNREMWENAATQRNVARLRNDGIIILGPDTGDQACGETGFGRMLEPEQLLEAVNVLNRPKVLAGYRALVTAGPTFEPIDPVRGLTNLSSGKMGYAVVQALIQAGADVTLVSGPTALPAPAHSHRISVVTASQMLEAVKANLDGVSLFFAIAAVADYTPARPKPQKQKKSMENMSVELVPTTDILAWVSSQAKPPFCVGFAAESENVVEYARKKREKKQIPMIVANQAALAIGADHNEITIIDADGDHPISLASKAEIAKLIVAHAARLFLQSHKRSNAPSAVQALKSVKNA